MLNKIQKIDPALYRSKEWAASSSKVVFSGLGADEVGGSVGACVRECKGCTSERTWLGI